MDSYCYDGRIADAMQTSTWGPMRGVRLGPETHIVCVRRGVVTKAESVFRLVFPGVRSDVDFQAGIVYIACPQAVLTNFFADVRVCHF